MDLNNWMIIKAVKSFLYLLNRILSSLSTFALIPIAYITKSKANKPRIENQNSSTTNPSVLESEEEKIDMGKLISKSQTYDVQQMSKKEKISPPVKYTELISNNTSQTNAKDLEENSDVATKTSEAENSKIHTKTYSSEETVLSTTEKSNEVLVCKTDNEVVSKQVLPANNQSRTAYKRKHEEADESSKTSNKFKQDVPKQGYGKGIEYHNNSCYMDSTLFAMFSYWKVFDSRFLEGNFVKEPRDKTSEKITQLLQTIVNKLRDGYCPSSYVADLRSSMLHINSRLQSTMMDVDELVSNLFGRALHLVPFIEYTAGTITTRSYMHQLLIHPTKVREPVGSVEELLKESMKMQGLKLNGLPQPAFIIKMPRSNGQLVGHTFILPNLLLDVSDIMNEGFSGTTQLHLIAVIVLKCYHYTTYVRHGTDESSPWVYFNSMPANVCGVSELGEKLTKFQISGNFNSKTVPADLNRILGDIHVCIYMPETDNKF